MVGTVTSRRTTLSAIALLIALLGSTALPLCAEPASRNCATRPDDCRGTTTMTTCCCCGHGDESNQGGTTETDVQLSASLAPVSGVVEAAAAQDPCRTPIRQQTSPTRSGSLDLPTLFATLLI
jgi:hypothetical protein